jgi:hypothetical protein
MYNEQRQLARDSDAIPLFSKTKQAFFWMCFTFFSNRRDAKKNQEKKTLRHFATLRFNCFNRREAKKNQEKKTLRLFAPLRLKIPE